MEQQEYSHKPLDIKNLVNNSATLFKNNFKLLFLLGIIGSIPISLSEYINVNYEGTLFSTASYVIAYLIFGWTMMSLTYASWKLLNDENVNIQESLSSVSNSFFRFILSMILYFLLLFVGLILLILPGLYLGTIFSFCYIPIILEHKNVIEGFKISKNLIKGYFWVILLIGIIVVAVSIVFYIISGLLGGVTKEVLYGLFCAISVPYLTILEVSIYKKLKTIKQIGSSTDV